MIRIAVEDGLYLKSLELRESEPLMLLIDSNRPYLRRWLPWLDMTPIFQTNATRIIS